MSVFITGDKHGKVKPIKNFAKNNALSSDDVIVVLGDAGFNFFNNEKDGWTKKAVQKCEAKILCIHGNHEMRPQSLPEQYHEEQWHDGTVFVQNHYPNILFAKDGEIYDLDGQRAIAIGGAYSVDKYYRLMNRLPWFPDEQPDDATKKHVEDVLAKCNWNVDIVLTHTCPSSAVPTEAFLEGIDQSTVDSSTEEWLGKIEEKLDYKRWYCGHWHIEKTYKKVRFLYDSFVPLEG